MDPEFAAHVAKKLGPSSPPGDLLAPDDLRSWVRAFVYDPRRDRIVHVEEGKNDRLFGGSDIIARLLAGDEQFKPATIYFEFENLAVSGTPIPAPSFDRSDGIDYYLSLSGSSVKDFLRVPMVLNPEVVASAGDFAGNQVNYFAISEGTSGFHGRAFSDTANSEVYGAALVATPTIDSQDDDIVYARSYDFTQVPKQAGFQIGLQWFVRAN